MRRAGSAVLSLACLGFGAASWSRAAEARVETKTAHYTPQDQQTRRYATVPFAVPAGTTRIRIALKFDKAGGANVVDLGLFEPGSLEVGTEAFRGWSGGERSEIEIGIDKSTSGYWPGPIAAGTWNVMLGLYKVADAGVDVELRIETGSEAARKTPEIAKRPTQPIRRGSAWYSGALHSHTWNSDGALPPIELAKRARAEGLDFLVITDHNNTVSQLDEINEPGLLTITGEEITTPGGHMNAWGLRGFREFIDFRVLPGEAKLGALIADARKRGTVFAVNHPRASCVACSWTHEIPEGVSALEIVNGPPAETVQAIAMWDTLLRAGRRLVGVGTSDWHRGDAPIGRASVRVRADELSERTILSAIEAGRVIVMGDATTPPPALTIRAVGRESQIGDTILVAKGEAIEIVAAPGLSPAYESARVDLVWRGEVTASATFQQGRPVRFERFAMAPGYFRLHVTTADGQPLAITNPIFLELKK